MRYILLKYICIFKHVEKKDVYKKVRTKVAISAKPNGIKKYHVITGDKEKWNVVADGNVRATRIFSTKLGAIEFATETANLIEGEVIIHKETGEIEKRVSLNK